MESHRNEVPNIGLCIPFSSRLTSLNTIYYVAALCDNFSFPLSGSAEICLFATLGATMTHWHDPAVLTLEEGSSVFFFRSWLPTYAALLGSCFDQVYARHRWRIYVSYIYLTFG
jgi:hypothetical protein